jgi:hypothetical protein
MSAVAKLEAQDATGITANNKEEYDRVTKAFMTFDHTDCEDAFNGSMCTVDHDFGVYYDSGWGGDGPGTYSVGACGEDGSVISDETFKLLRLNGVIGGNMLITSKARRWHPALFGRTDSSVVGDALYRDTWMGAPGNPTMHGCDGKPLFKGKQGRDLPVKKAKKTKARSREKDSFDSDSETESGSPSAFPQPKQQPKKKKKPTPDAERLKQQKKPAPDADSFEATPEYAALTPLERKFLHLKETDVRGVQLAVTVSRLGLAKATAVSMLPMLHYIKMENLEADTAKRMLESDAKVIVHLSRMVTRVADKTFISPRRQILNWPL